MIERATWPGLVSELSAGGRLHISVEAPGTFDIASFDRMGEADNTGEPMVLDLSRVTFIDPYAMVALACCIEEAPLCDQEVVFIPPASATVRRYLARMHLHHALLDFGGVEDHGLPTVRERPLTGRLVELQRFDRRKEFEDLVDMVSFRLDGVVSSGRLDRIYETMIEVGSNVLDHADSEGGWIAGQVFNRGRPQEKVVFAIGDVGIGIRESLMNGGVSADNDQGAIRMALESGVSRLEGRGEGLPTVVEFSKDLGGIAVVRSGQGRCMATPNRTYALPVPYLTGTLVGVVLPCARR